MKREYPIELKMLKYQPKLNTTLNRYMTIDQLLDFLVNKHIPLIRLDLFEDKLEGTKIEHIVLNNESEKMASNLFSEFDRDFLNININPINRNKIRDEREIFQKTNFASCWYCSEHESVAMWNLYSHPNSVAVRVNYNALIRSLESGEINLSYPSKNGLKIGRVKYTVFRKADNNSPLDKDEFTPGFIKDESFSHENEFRLILEIEKISERNSIGAENLIKENLINWDNVHDLKAIFIQFAKIEEIPFEIIFHPRSNVWHQSNIKYILNNNNLNIATYKSNLCDILN
ncbi:MAG: hypothetical protein IPQ02_05360 [Saprospiraceae bacterium]|uniref:DUF2971 domain-containing protein n=1 Tax=Candidatus Defluviibacterium haderslevense TaxID=2981993 RepID=A0A9D7XDM0_9BACT|nr:hypothetical protein [Candidatus Defluviibacterium haderslevense]MBL0236046.1 hypothetical protein [Candidatus Defluviibacterium haderslevense]